MLPMIRGQKACTQYPGLCFWSYAPVFSTRNVARHSGIVSTLHTPAFEFPFWGEWPDILGGACDHTRYSGSSRPLKLVTEGINDTMAFHGQGITTQNSASRGSGWRAICRQKCRKTLGCRYAGRPYACGQSQATVLAQSLVSSI